MKRLVTTTRVTRASIALALAGATGLLTYLIEQTRGLRWLALDFTYPWAAARGLLAGQNAYSYVPTHVGEVLGRVFLYPLPAAIIALPLAPLPPQLAGAVFVGVGCGLLAYAVTRRGYWWLAIFASGPAYQVYFSVQWSPLLMAAAIWAPAIGVLVAKPNAAIPLFAYQSSVKPFWYALVGGGVLMLISLAASPTWPVDWLRTLATAREAGQYRIPMLTGWGLVLWLPLLRWKRPEARLVLAMACIPQNGFFYDQFPLLLVADTPVEVVGLSLVSLSAKLVIGDPLGYLSPKEWTDRLLPVVIAFLYLPCIVLVLRRRNESNDRDAVR